MINTVFSICRHSLAQEREGEDHSGPRLLSLFEVKAEALFRLICVLRLMPNSNYSPNYAKDFAITIDAREVREKR